MNPPSVYDNAIPSAHSTTRMMRSIEIMMMNLSCDDRRGAWGVMSVSLCTHTVRSSSGGVAHFQMKREGATGSP
jgi:hypothetical protein